MLPLKFRSTVNAVVLDIPVPLAVSRLTFARLLIHTTINVFLPEVDRPPTQVPPLTAPPLTAAAAVVAALLAASAVAVAPRPSVGAPLWSGLRLGNR